MKSWAIARLREKSTYKGLAMFAGLLGAAVSPEQLEAIGAAVLAVVAAIETFGHE